MEHLTKQRQWAVSVSSEVVEFSGCDYDGKPLSVGRFYFQNDQLIGDTLWSKRDRFLQWADQPLHQRRNSSNARKTLNAYVGKEQQHRDETGDVSRPCSVGYPQTGLSRTTALSAFNPARENLMPRAQMQRLRADVMSKKMHVPNTRLLLQESAAHLQDSYYVSVNVHELLLLLCEFNHNIFRFFR